MGASTRTPAEFRDDFRSAFSSFWTGAGESLDIVAWDNLDPATLNADWATLDAYIFLGLAHASGSQVSLGTGVDIQMRRVVVFAGQVFVRHNTGQAEADRLAELLLDFVESTKLTGIRFRDQGMTEIGRVNQWFQVNVNAQVEYDSYRSV